MRISMLIGMMVAATGVASTSTAARADSGSAGRWQGLLLRNGQQAAAELDLDGAAGQLRVEDRSTPLDAVRVTPTAAHFEAAGEGVFEGTVAGESMAGSVSGACAGGSFALSRQTASQFGDAITSSGP
jgi:hypothetical protein